MADPLDMSVETARAPASLSPLLEAHSLSKSYWRGRGSSNRNRVFALREVSIRIFARSSCALVGKSGSGKSTLARCLVLLETPDSGEIRFEGRDLSILGRAALAGIRPNFQLVFQHSAMALNPRFSALEAVAEPLRVQKLVNKKMAHERAIELIERVGISSSSAQRSVLEFSGGQRQRLALARALILQPKLLILDEVLSGLDTSTQSSITELLLDMQASLSLSYLLMTHDLRMAAYLASAIAVIDDGTIVETGGVAELFLHPQREETRELIEAIPKVSNPR
jgi:ABC-type glutathione transport system ATPase component